MTAPIVAPGAPYINPTILTAATTGISWSTIPERKASPDAQEAEQLNICMRATAMVDEWCNQPLRATLDTETLTGPGTFEVQIQPDVSGTYRLLMSRGPVSSIVSGQVSAAAAFPRQWQDIPANQFEPERPLMGVYGTSAPGSSGAGGQAIILAPGWLGSARGGSRLQVVYINGWPHGSVLTQATAGASTMVVDDITGWDGAAGILFDNSDQEAFTVTAVTPVITDAVAGPGTLTLASALQFDHQPGTICSTLPGSVQQATILFAVVQALARGATSTAVQTLSAGPAGSGGSGADDFDKMAKALLQPYRRFI